MAPRALLPLLLLVSTLAHAQALPAEFWLMETAHPEAQAALSASPSWRAEFVAPRRLLGVFTAALEEELFHPMVTSEHDYLVELRPVLGWEWEHGFFTASPVLGVPLSSLGGDWSVVHTLQAGGWLCPALSLAAEYAADLGPLGVLTPADEHAHVVSAVLGFEWPLGERTLALEAALGANVVTGTEWVGRLALTID